jgi:hypothetical protein
MYVRLTIFVAFMFLHYMSSPKTVFIPNLSKSACERPMYFTTTYLNVVLCNRLSLFKTYVTLRFPTSVTLAGASVTRYSPATLVSSLTCVSPSPLYPYLLTFQCTKIVQANNSSGGQER